MTSFPAMHASAAAFDARDEFAPPCAYFAAAAFFFFSSFFGFVLILLSSPSKHEC